MPSRAYRGGRAVSRTSFGLVAGTFLLLSTLFAVGVVHALHQISLPPPLTTEPKYLVFIVLDGARPSYLNLAPLPHVDALRADGVQFTNAFAGILESETPSGHATLSSGSTPARDGLLGFNWVPDDTQTVVKLFDPNVVRGGAIEHVLEQAHAPSIAGLYKARYPKAKVVAISGHKYYAADPLGGPSADYIMYYAPGPNNTYVATAIPGHVPPPGVMDGPGMVGIVNDKLGREDTLATNLALSAFRKLRQRITLINYPEFDWPLGHVYGGDTKDAAALMRNFDQNLGRLENAYRKAGVLDQTLFVITSDHGMNKLKYQIPDEVLSNAVTQAGTTAPEITYSTGGYIWLANKALAQAVAGNVLAAKNRGIQSVYYRVRAKTGDSYVYAGGEKLSKDLDGANQYLVQSFLGGNAPDVVVFCKEDAGFVKTGGGEHWKGNHGGGAWRSQHIPLVISGAGVAVGRVSGSPARMEDIAPSVLTMMGVKPTGMQGVPLTEAMLKPTAEQLQARQAVVSQLRTSVKAMVSQSRYDLAHQP